MTSPASQKAIAEANATCAERIAKSAETQQNDNPKQNTLFCPQIFDGWSCWNATPAGSTANTSCPGHVPGFDPNRFGHKVCDEDGNWFRHPDTNTTWSNYTTCIDVDDLAKRTTIIQINIIGYSISLVALLLSLMIFFYFRSLKCMRIRIHRNLFLSFVMNSAMYIVWYTVIVHPEVLFANQIGCQMLHIILQYFLVCNYFWMFCEGLYLHTILVVAFVDKESIMKWLYLIGWGIPIPLTVAYAVTRGAFPSETEHCWIENSPYYWILTGPVCVSMFANLIFLICIVRVLVTKLRAVKSSDTDQTKKAVRATIILIPLLGLQFLVTPFRPEPKSYGELIYDVISAVVTSFQGLCVSLLFCFCNAEIIYLVQNIWSQQRLFGCRRNTSLILSSVTVVNHSRNESQRYSSQRSKRVPARKSQRERNHICLSDIAPPPPTHHKRSLVRMWRRAHDQPPPTTTNNNKHKTPPAEGAPTPSFTGKDQDCEIKKSHAPLINVEQVIRNSKEDAQSV